jgi:hypothetical protein
MCFADPPLKERAETSSPINGAVATIKVLETLALVSGLQAASVLSPLL